MDAFYYTARGFSIFFAEVFLFYLPPVKSAKIFGQNFLSTTPRIVPKITTQKVAPKYSSRQKNVFFMGKNFMKSLEKIPFKTGL
jgi:hypothetical protein